MSTSRRTVTESKDDQRAQDGNGTSTRWNCLMLSAYPMIIFLLHKVMRQEEERKRELTRTMTGTVAAMPRGRGVGTRPKVKEIIGTKVEKGTLTEEIIIGRPPKVAIPIGIGTYMNRFDSFRFVCTVHILILLNGTTRSRDAWPARDYHREMDYRPPPDPRYGTVYPHMDYGWRSERDMPEDDRYRGDPSKRSKSVCYQCGGERRSCILF